MHNYTQQKINSRSVGQKTQQIHKKKNTRVNTRTPILLEKDVKYVVKKMHSMSFGKILRNVIGSLTSELITICWDMDKIATSATRLQAIAIPIMLAQRTAPLLVVCILSRLVVGHFSVVVTLVMAHKGRTLVRKHHHVAGGVVGHVHTRSLHHLVEGHIPLELVISRAPPCVCLRVIQPTPERSDEVIGNLGDTSAVWGNGERRRVLAGALDRNGRCDDALWQAEKLCEEVRAHNPLEQLERQRRERAEGVALREARAQQ
eukprot:TRINITY_DN18686_c0_g1_i1.p1 TRINITY_DN18686_c0_g1~~TRINITY_DN18686_c0_g1_i1.p1  ORF type:complete len:260 (-),score=0.92 TRINITY_DN18686_c0_g1_i1:57-836(-)